jgi:hypothetical protein
MFTFRIADFSDMVIIVILSAQKLTARCCLARAPQILTNNHRKSNPRNGLSPKDSRCQPPAGIEFALLLACLKEK